MQLRFHENVTRVKNLVTLYEKNLTTKKQGRQPVHSIDVLRAAVVLLHASLEDFLRTLAKERLSSASESVLNGIPLVGISEHGRAEKFYLGKLAEHKQKKVSDLIDESIASYLKRSNYNDTKEIASLLEQANLDVTDCRKHFPNLDQMMQRRHQIVHKADCNEKRGYWQQMASGLNKITVRAWIDEVEAFVKTVERQLD